MFSHRLRIYLLAGFVVLMCDAYAMEPVPECQTRIEGFEFEGNKVTRSDYLVARSGLAKDRMITPSELDRVRQKLMDTQLFVDAEVSAITPCADQSIVAIRVREKRYHLVYPRVSRNGNGDIDKGFRYRANNLFGSNHTFSVMLAQKDYSNGNTSNRMVTDYDMTLPDQTYHLRWSALRSNTLIETTGGQNEEFDKEVSMLVGRDWLSLDLPEPLTVFAKFSLQSRVTNESTTGNTLLDANYNTLGVQFEYDAVHYQHFRRSGYFLSLEANRGMSGLESDYDTSHFVLEARSYVAFANQDNFNSRYLIAIATENVFGGYNYALGGADSIRGIEQGSISGNTLIQANLEYVMSFDSWPSFRMSFFSDVGNVFDRHTDLNDDWTSTVGTGLRWKLTSFVKTDLVIDMGYEPRTGYSKIYFSTHLPF